MRIPIDLPEDQLAELTRLAERERVSRTSLVRRAIADLLAAKRRAGDEAIAAAFGIWADREEDGLAYQERLRSEWDGRGER
jgi:metal-responsive CopG/Arc/MetJ family transcriptional regulator